jgi:hypothetical protein
MPLPKFSEEKTTILKTWLPNIIKSLLVQLEINLLKLLTMETLVVLHPVHVGLAVVTVTPTKIASLG